jgi:3-methyladenine DNA glycosylase/8-oxoguanine DNA glycosylase
MRCAGGEVQRASRTPHGSVALWLRASGSAIEAEAWGHGREWALDHLEDLVGLSDDVSRFRPRHPLVAALRHRMPGLRMSRTSSVLEALIPAILEQKVTGAEARRSWRGLVHRFSEPAPGPLGLWLPPDPDFLGRQPYHAFHAVGLERRRAEVVSAVCRQGAFIEAASALPTADACRRLRLLPGVGAWTAAEVAVRAWGDADAVSVGDYHTPSLVAWCLAGEARADDSRMLALLAPFAGHRARVVRLLEASGIRVPRFGPRLPVRNIARL